MVKNKCDVVAFIDKYKSGFTMEGLFVYKVEEVKFDESVPCVITATYDFENISNEMREYHEKATIISLEDILDGKLYIK